eukprot:CAMPEP_0114598046 /NCGR_PEP_ID=MMETSP0125-20121206/20395_1 /TAXON_ID=485358 ORGANISM="Aristerostoma sp., Strain ATCC 50986" /NCGR_SAMPLE_ID=MMETSP0125 /ASSEMBLY_ACC=CAM_ASM_000245 /LENGTH=314 /DNA_ID=CAMNT_0001803343 /DNA_START=148 /DNA_END=1092 /DNA_ORIENTATION=+
MAQSEYDSQEDEEDPDEICDDFSPDYIKRNVTQTGRPSISAEAFGQYNKKENFKPRVIVKTEEQKKTIFERLSQAFMFEALDEKEKKIVVDAMEVHNIKKDTWVIRQGEDGDLLYVVHEGTLDCYKKKKDEDEKKVKTYNPGESFGELALLYNAPRAASIQAVTDCTLFGLDRATFNNIVKDAEMRRREGYEELLEKIQILKPMDPYDRIMLTECFKHHSFDEGDVIIGVGSEVDAIYFVEDGTVVAKSGDDDIGTHEVADYFGEFALINDSPSEIQFIAESDVELISLSKEHFFRLLKPVMNDIEAAMTTRYQ